jgi:hypothetical protein
MNGQDLISQFDYPEVKDLAKQFITVATGVLFFSMTFSEKLITPEPERRSWRNWLVIGTLSLSWALLVVSIVLAGMSIREIFIAAYLDIHQHQGIGDHETAALREIKSAGALFILGLSVMAVTWVSHLVLKVLDARKTQGIIAPLE